jgi:hypothetical protein
MNRTSMIVAASVALAGLSAAVGAAPASGTDARPGAAASGWRAVLANAHGRLPSLARAERPDHAGAVTTPVGRVGGPGRKVTSVKARATDTYTITFRGGEQASILVNGDGDTDLDLYVYDENGNLVASDADATDTCLCQWTPRWTGQFTVKVRNRGSVYNRYVLVTN